MNKKIIITVAAVLVVVIGALAVFFAVRKNDDQQAQKNNTQAIEQAEQNEEQNTSVYTDEEAEKAGGAQKDEAEKPKVKPTFMYFIADKDIENTNEVLEKLKKEYGEKVVFDVRNVDKDPSQLDNFELVRGQTPALIMLNTSNDISGFLFQNAKYDDLKGAIETALK